jgi:hypothetical protein
MAPDDVGERHSIHRIAYLVQRCTQHTPRASNEWFALLVLLDSGTFAADQNGIIPAVIGHRSIGEFSEAALVAV